MGFQREARRVRDHSLPHDQRLRSLAHCLEWSRPIGFQPSWNYLEAKLAKPRGSVDFLVPALDLLERERNLYLALDQRYSTLRRQLKRRGSRAPRPDEVTSRSPLRWHGDEREGAVHALRWWLEHHPLEHVADDAQTKLAVDVARLLAQTPKPASVDVAGLQEALDRARGATRDRTRRTTAVGQRARDVIHLLGQIHIVLNGAPLVGTPWNFTASPDEKTHMAAAAREYLRSPVGLWRGTPDRGATDLIDTAADLLVLGYDTLALRELAGMSPRDSFYDVEPAVTAALEQLGVADLLEGSAHRAGLEARLELFLGGELTLREVSNWAHRTIGHEGDDDLQPFVELDDVYDDWEVTGQDLSCLDLVTRRAARDFLAGRPVTQLDWPGPPAPTATRVAQVRRPRWRDRPRRRELPAR